MFSFTATTVYMNLGHSTSAQTVLVGPTDDASSYHCLYHDLARHDMRYTTVAAVLGMSLPNDDHLCERTTAQGNSTFFLSLTNVVFQQTTLIFDRNDHCAND